jgi:hypothetical protein
VPVKTGSHFTALRIGLVKVLRRPGTAGGGPREPRLLLDEAAPTNPVEWSMRDVPETRALLNALAL